MDLSGDMNTICGMNVKTENDIKIIHLLGLYTCETRLSVDRSFGLHLGRRMNEWMNEKWMKRKQARHFPVNAHWIFIDIECGHGNDDTCSAGLIHNEPSTSSTEYWCYTKKNRYYLNMDHIFANACFPSTHSVHSPVSILGSRWLSSSWCLVLSFFSSLN